MSNGFSQPASMTREEFREWAKTQSGRFDRFDGVVAAMAPEHIAHNRLKQGIWLAFRNAVKAAGAP
jgi:Uma2 family endonuclease